MRLARNKDGEIRIHMDKPWKCLGVWVYDEEKLKIQNV